MPLHNAMSQSHYQKEGKEKSHMPKTKTDTLEEASCKLTARLERVANAGLATAKERSEALVKVYEAQYEAGVELLKKSTDTLKGLTEGKIAEKAQRLVDQAVASGRASANGWIEFAQGSLGSVRRVLAAAVEHDRAS
jgi:hypothetical protein